VKLPSTFERNQEIFYPGQQFLSSQEVHLLNRNLPPNDKLDRIPVRRPRKTAPSKKRKSPKKKKPRRKPSRKKPAPKKPRKKPGKRKSPVKKRGSNIGGVAVDPKSIYNFSKK